MVKSHIGGRPFTRRAARQAHKAAERIRDEDGEEWLAPRVAARYVQQTQTTLALWAAPEGKCPWLDGAAVETRSYSGVYNRKITYYRRRDLDRINAAMAARQPVPSYPGLVYIEQAAAELGVSIRTLRRMLKGSKAKVVRRAGKSIDGRALPRSYVPLAFVEAVKAERTAPAEAGKIAIAEAAAILGLTEQGVYGLVYGGELHRVQGQDGGRANAVLLSRVEVEAVKKAREAEDLARFAVAGRWLDTRELARANEISKPYMIRLLREWKRAGKLRPRRGFRWQDGPPRRRHPVLLWDAEAVERLLVAKRAGGTAAEVSPPNGDGVAGTPGPRLNDTQQAIVGWLREHGPDFAKNIARGLGFPFNSRFRATLRGLVERGTLRHGSAGYATEFSTHVTG